MSIIGKKLGNAKKHNGQIWSIIYIRTQAYLCLHPGIMSVKE